MSLQQQQHRRSYVEEILIQLLTAKLGGERNDDQIWDFLRGELLDLHLRYGKDVDDKFVKYVTKALEILLSDINDYTIPLFNVWNAKEKLIVALKDSKTLMNRIKSKYIRTDEQEREVLNIVNSVLISSAKSVLKDYKVIWDESV
ncbi:hypothetical protein AVT98_gp05 [Sulfolobales virus YNP1]|uniref:hypothetical protein n=1 Tax=Sulfolobales virus YNP1 TaxID=1732179 RepID=UPI0007061EAE|nr:hypothetical protein AVT98_gp05 [Sulfolobales virus YNP1]ALG97097.1 hypothetical protein [Sulfolobales virus YNP1]